MRPIIKPRHLIQQRLIQQRHALIHLYLRIIARRPGEPIWYVARPIRLTYRSDVAHRLFQRANHPVLFEVFAAKFHFYVILLQIIALIVYLRVEVISIGEESGVSSDDF